MRVHQPRARIVPARRFGFLFVRRKSHKRINRANEAFDVRRVEGFKFFTDRPKIRSNEGTPIIEHKSLLN